MKKFQKIYKKIGQIVYFDVKYIYKSKKYQFSLKKLLLMFLRIIILFKIRGENYARFRY